MEKLQKQGNQQISKNELPKSTTFIIKAILDTDHESFERFCCAIQPIEAIQGTQISLLRNQNEAQLKTILHFMIEDVIIHFGAFDKFGTNGIVSTVGKVLASYWWLKIEELAYVFKQGKSGAYGKIYGFINQATILDWIKQYDLTEREDLTTSINEFLNSDSKRKVLEDSALVKLYDQKFEFDKKPYTESKEYKAIEKDAKEDEYKKAKAEYFKKQTR